MKKSDLGDVFSLQREFEFYLQGLTDKPRKTSIAEQERRFFKDGFGKNPAFRGIVARDRGKLLGYLCYHFGYDPDEMKGRVVYVIDLFVTNEARARGVGTLLMGSVARLCSSVGGIAVYVCVWKKNKKAIRFYKSIGAEWVTDVPLMAWESSKWKSAL
jgi:GNAT superfamily N-acetyltransferase